jgi:hypothetical protein
MPMPGFAGESSLQKSGNYYNHARSATPRRPTARIIEPAACIRGCICVTEEGCPCCANLLDFFGTRPKPFERALG